jgi:hypothetical protein
MNRLEQKLNKLLEGDVVQFKGRYPARDDIALILSVKPDSPDEEQEAVLDLIHEFLLAQQYPMKDKIKALAHFDLLMGIEGSMPTEKDVWEYLEDFMEQDDAFI